MKTKIYILLVIVLGACSNVSNPDKNGKLKVVTTTGMIYDAVLKIGGDSVDVEALMGPGVDPHLYKATQGDLSKLNAANIIFYNGLHLEGKMGEIFEKLGRTKEVVAVAEVIPKNRLRLSEAFQNNIDPHVWFDVSLWKYVVGEVNINLKRLDQKNADYFQTNTAKYLSQLDSLHAVVTSRIATIPAEQRILITSHDAFGYLGDAYGIEVNALQGISTVSDFGLKDIANLIDIITTRNVKAVFVETSVSQKALKAVVDGARENGVDVSIGGSLFSDAMGDFDTFEGTYVGMVDKNVSTIVNSLGDSLLVNE